jgi:hypothetical protein
MVPGAWHVQGQALGSPLGRGPRETVGCHDAPHRPTAPRCQATLADSALYVRQLRRRLLELEVRSESAAASARAAAAAAAAKDQGGDQTGAPAARACWGPLHHACVASALVPACLRVSNRTGMLCMRPAALCVQVASQPPSTAPAQAGVTGLPGSLLSPRHAPGAFSACAMRAAIAAEVRDAASLPQDERRRRIRALQLR